MFDLSLLAKATEKGIISKSQEQDLVAFFQETSADGLVARDEAPRFFRSFNDLFIGLGIFILGWALISGAALVPAAEQIIRVLTYLGCALIFWLLAEWITRVRRINFPSIIIACFFSFFFIAAMVYGWELFIGEVGSRSDLTPSKTPLPVVIVAGLSTVALLGFFLRFRLPFSLLLVASGVMLTSITTLFLIFGSDALQPIMRWIFLVAGLLVFTTAMYFDTQDPMRTQRTSDHGFWLHLLAAPIITHSVLWTSLQPIMTSSADAEPAANLMVLVVLGMFVVFSLIALVIDRRALLISSLGYASAALGYIIYKFNIEGTLALVITLILIATLILTLGTGWYKLRRIVFKCLPEFAFLGKLPPLKN